jgi:16S rRNA processing protein RimM
VVGRVGRAHGLDGSVLLNDHAGTISLEPGLPVLVGERPARIVASGGTPARPRVRFDLARTREEAEELRGALVSIASEQLPEPAPGEYFHVDLIGCRVVAGDRVVGTVAAVHAYPANDVLELDDAGSTLVPFVADAVLEVDVAGRRIALRPEFL